MDNNLRREIIVDNASNPFHKETKGDDFIKANTHNESCIDNIMINEEEYNEEELGELNAYSDISKQASRKKCAILPFQTLEKTFKIYEK